MKKYSILRNSEPAARVTREPMNSMDSQAMPPMGNGAADVDKALDEHVPHHKRHHRDKDVLKAEQLDKQQAKHHARDDAALEHAAYFLDGIVHPLRQTPSPADVKSWGGAAGT